MKQSGSEHSSVAAISRSAIGRVVEVGCGGRSMLKFVMLAQRVNFTTLCIENSEFSCRHESRVELPGQNSKT